MTARKLCGLALMSALMVGTQVAMASIPNVHLVAVLVILAVIAYGGYAFYSVAVFVLLEGVIYGFGIWWFFYLYAWPLYTLVVLLMRHNKSRLVWACVAGLFGLLFGALSAIPYLFISGTEAAIAYWVSGIPFDVAHGLSNFVLTFILVPPLSKAILKLR